MAVTTREAILLGNFADADSDEGTYTLEDPSVYLGTFGSAGSPLYQNSVNVTFDDANTDNAIFTDNSAAEDIVVDTGSGLETTFVDSLAVVDVTVTYTNGTVTSYNNAVVFQDGNGNVYLTNSDFAGTDLSGPSAIESVNITAITGDGYSGLYHNALQGFVCYVAGTSIRTPLGERLVEELAVGDEITTLDNGPQPIRWIGDATVAATPDQRPVRIAQGALAKDVPYRDLYVSQQNRMLVQSSIVERATGYFDTLVCAKRFMRLPKVTLAKERKEVRYLHLMCDRHEIIFANGAASETLLPGPQALTMLGQDVRHELEAIFSARDLARAAAIPARSIQTGAKQKRIIDRHLWNKKPLTSVG